MATDERPFVKHAAARALVVNVVSDVVVSDAPLLEPPNDPVADPLTDPGMVKVE
jgi:hypothetical protein